MRVYMHYDGVPEFTKVIRVEEAGEGSCMTVAQALEVFLKDFKGRHGEHTLHRDPARVAVHNAKGKPVALGGSIAGTFADKEDAFVVLVPVSEQIEELSRHHAVQESSVDPADIPTGTVPSSRVSSSSHALIFQAAFHRAESAMQARNLRAAEAIYQQLLQICPDDPLVLEKLARLWLQAGKAKLAVHFARLAAKHAPLESSALQQLLGETCMWVPGTGS